MEADATYLRSYFGNPAAYNLRRLPRTGGGGRGEEEEEEERGGTTRFYAVDATTFRQLYNACCTAGEKLYFSLPLRTGEYRVNDKSKIERNFQEKSGGGEIEEVESVHRERGSITFPLLLLGK